MSTLSRIYLKCFSSVLVGGGKLVSLFHKKLDDVCSVSSLYYKSPHTSSHKYEMYYPKNQAGKKLPILFYIHGGGWATLDLSLYQTLCRRFAQKGFVVFNLNYPLASSSSVHIEDILASVEEGIENIVTNLSKFAQNIEIDDSSVYISGDSAGAHIASMVALRAANNKYSLFLHQFLTSQKSGTLQQNLDINELTASQTQIVNTDNLDDSNSQGLVLTNPCKRGSGSLAQKTNPKSFTKKDQSYLNKIAPLTKESVLANRVKGLFLFYGVYNFETVRATRYPRIDMYVDALFGSKKKENKDKMYAFSPINFVDKDFPPVFITSGEIDKLHNTQSKVFAQKLIDLGVKTQVEFFDKTVKTARHGFMTFDNLASTQTIYTKIDKFLNWIKN